MADSPDPQPTATASPRSGFRPVTVAIVVGAVVLGLGLAWLLASRNQDKGTPQEFLKADAVGSPVRSIGPLKGTDLNRYSASRSKALAKTHDRRVAVVSLDRYTTDRE